MADAASFMKLYVTNYNYFFIIHAEFMALYEATIQVIWFESLVSCLYHLLTFESYKDLLLQLSVLL